MMRALLGMIRANIKMTVRNRSALFWNLVFPALFIVIFGAVFGGNDGAHFDVGIAGEPSVFKEQVTAALRQADAITVRSGTVEQELAALKDGDLDIVVVFGQADSQGRPPVHLYYDETDGPNAQVGLSVVRQILLSVAQAEQPLPITEEPVTGADISFIDFFVPGILAMALMNAGVIGVSTAFVSFRERGILRRIKVTPFPLSSFIAARIVAQLIVAVAQALILIALGVVLFGLQLRGNPLVILLAVVIGSL
ncbi:MAG: hypothetical protein C4345_02805, partial [Chloroflexota bacterium]